MTTTKEAAGLVEGMLGVCDALDRAGMHILARFCQDVAPTITALLTQVEELRRERDGLRSIVSKMTNALPSGAYCSPEASLEFMEHLPDEVLLCTSRLVDRATKAEAGIAEAMEVCERFAKAPYMGNNAFNRAALSDDDFRAARAFVEKHKESRT